MLYRVRVRVFPYKSAEQGPYFRVIFNVHTSFGQLAELRSRGTCRLFFLKSLNLKCDLAVFFNLKKK